MYDEFIKNDNHFQSLENDCIPSTVETIKKNVFNHMTNDFRNFTNRINLYCSEDFVDFNNYWEDLKSKNYDDERFSD